MLRHADGRLRRRAVFPPAGASIAGTEDVASDSGDDDLGRLGGEGNDRETQEEDAEGMLSKVKFFLMWNIFISSFLSHLPDILSCLKQQSAYLQPICITHCNQAIKMQIGRPECSKAESARLLQSLKGPQARLRCVRSFSNAGSRAEMDSQSLQISKGSGT